VHGSSQHYVGIQFGLNCIVQSETTLQRERERESGT